MSLHSNVKVVVVTAVHDLFYPNSPIDPNPVLAQRFWGNNSRKRAARKMSFPQGAAYMFVCGVTTYSMSPRCFPTAARKKSAVASASPRESMSLATRSRICFPSSLSNETAQTSQRRLSLGFI